jgi:hypothetical protein
MAVNLRPATLLTLHARGGARRESRITQQAASSLRFDLLMAALGSLFVGGLFVDGWAHINQPALETFFTPWHGVFYSGFFAVLAALAAQTARNHARGLSWRAAIPAGYELSALGAGLFVLGGLGDMLWHIAFGIEVNIEALLSPTHLLLASSIALLITGPLRAAWRPALTSHTSGWLDRLPMLLSLTALLSLFTFFTQYIYPLASPDPAASYAPRTFDLLPLHPGIRNPIDLSQSVSLGGVIVQSALLAGFLLIALRRGPPSFGSLTLMIGVNAALMVAMHQKYEGVLELPLLVNALVAGLGADVVLALLRPSLMRVATLRAFAAVVPMLVIGAYLVTLGLSEGLWWSINLWAGSVFLAGVAGWLTAFGLTQSAVAELAEQAPLP